MLHVERKNGLGDVAATEGPGTLIGLVLHVTAVVEIQTEEGEGDADGLDIGGGVAEPENGDDDDKNTFDEAGHGVCHGRDHREQDESKDVLTKVEGPIEHKFKGEPTVVK